MQVGYGTHKLEGQAGLNLCRHAYDVGYRIFDTALAYGNQEIVGDALYKYTDRSAICIISKIAKPDIEKYSVRLCVEKILRELKIDYVDVLLIHSPKGIDHKHVLPSMAALQQEKKILKIGVSNYTIKHLDAIKAFDITPQVTQMEIHPYLVENEYELYCKAHNMQLMSHTSLANGLIIKDVALSTMAKENDCTVAQLVLSWLNTRGITPIVGSKDYNNIANNSYHNLKLLNQELIKKINKLNINMRICNNPSWAEFD